MVTTKTATKKAAAKRPVRKAPAKKTAPKKRASTATRQTTKKSTPRKRTTTATKTNAAKKSTPRKRQPPKKPAVDDVVEGMLDNQPADTPGANGGPVEASTGRELRLLKIDRTALGAAALTLARLADQAESAIAAATVLRELRMTLGTARTVGAISDPHPTPTKSEEENVVPESRLEALRREAAARGRTK